MVELNDCGFESSCHLKIGLRKLSLVPGFGLIADRDLILGDRLLSLMTQKYIIIKGCFQKESTYLQVWSKRQNNAKNKSKRNKTKKCFITFLNKGHLIAIDIVYKVFVKTNFDLNFDLHSVVLCMSKNLLLETGAIYMPILLNGRTKWLWFRILLSLKDWVKKIKSCTWFWANSWQGLNSWWSSSFFNDTEIHNYQGLLPKRKYLLASLIKKAK